MATSGNFFIQLQKKLNIRTRNKELYKKAFTHSSVNLKDKEGRKFYFLSFERLFNLERRSFSEEEAVQRLKL